MNKGKEKRQLGRKGIEVKKSFSFEKLMATCGIYRPPTRTHHINLQ
jgi:hypothetical protein